jgi:hypothetical protein
MSANTADEKEEKFIAKIERSSLLMMYASRH